MLKDYYKTFVENASALPGFIVGQKEDVPYDIDILANGYCDAEDSNDNIKKGQYLSALMVRYWHMIPTMYNNDVVKNQYEIEDMIYWLFESFEKAFKYRSWRDNSKTVSKDKKGAEKVINRCIFSVQNGHYQDMNRDKRKMAMMCDSLDGLIATANATYGFTEDRLDFLAQEDDDLKNVNCRDIIENMLLKDKLFEAIIVDCIAFQDVFKEDTFSRSKLYNIIKTLHSNTSYKNYLVKSYSISKEVLNDMSMKLSKTSRQTVSSRITNALLELSKNEELKSALC